LLPTKASTQNKAEAGPDCNIILSLMPNNIATTTAQSLGALLKSARDIMRKDEGLNGDLSSGL